MEPKFMEEKLAFKNLMMAAIDAVEKEIEIAIADRG
jgi:hypothetical protein